MSTMSIIKNKANIYDGYNFQNIPFETTDKFSIYIPEERDTLSELVKKSQDPKYTQNVFRSPVMSPTKTKQVFFSKEGEQQISRTKSNLLRDIENAKALEVKELPLQKNEEIHEKTAEKQAHFETNASNMTSPKKRIVIKDLADSRQMEKFKQSLYFDEKTRTLPKTTFKNKVVEGLLDDYDSLSRNKNLLSYVYKIKNLQLLKTPKLKVI